MFKRPVHLLIEDIWDAIERIERFTKGFDYEIFSKDEKTSDAVVRNLEIIGEATSRLPNEFKEKYPVIAWEEIVGLRHRIVHDYFGIDLEIIWHIISNDLPIFKNRIQSIRNESQN